MRANSSEVKVYASGHGLYTLDGDRFTDRIILITSSVNFDRKAMQALRAAISEAVEHDYFDADLALLAAVSLEVNFDDFTINEIMAKSDDKAWVDYIQGMYAPMPSF